MHKPNENKSAEIEYVRQFILKETQNKTKS